MIERKKLFDIYAEDYFKYRPYLPKKVGSFLIEKALLTSSSRILEIGCGTGQATLAFEGTNLSIIAMDIGKNLINLAKKHNTTHLNIDWVCSSFEDYQSEQEQLDLVFSSMAIHWIDPTFAYQKIARILKSKGFFSIISLKRNYPENLDKDLRKVYQSFPEIEKFSARPSVKTNLENVRIEREKYFKLVEDYRFSFNISYRADQYVGLMKTMSPHRSLDPIQQTAIYNRIGNVFGDYEPVEMENMVTIQFFQKME